MIVLSPQLGFLYWAQAQIGMARYQSDTEVINFSQNIFTCYIPGGLERWIQLPRQH